MLKLVDLSEVESISNDADLIKVMHNKYWVMIDNKIAFNTHNGPLCNSDVKISNEFATNFSLKYDKNFVVKFIEKVYLPISIDGYMVDLNSFVITEVNYE